MPGSILVLVLMMCAKSLDAQPPAANTPADAPPASAATPPTPNLPNLPDVPDFDLEAEGLENFGEEGFQVEEQLSPAAETTVTAIKIAVGAAIVLLFGFIVMKLLRRKSSVRS
ncbi:MAG: hypothetical protein R3C56_10000 [Pirellulaceae bacterium]